MERHVKERLVGAAVLMAAAIILIPEMLSGPKPGPGAPAPRAADEAPLKTYTIDLQQSAGGAPAAALDDRSPPPEQEIAAEASPAAKPSSEAQANAEPSASSPQPIETAPREQAPMPAPTPPQTQPKPPETTARLPQAATPSPPTSQTGKGSGQWAVQVGSFSKQATADRLATELRAGGQDAFVMPVRSGASTFYRVRVGPIRDRASADAAVSTLRTKFPGAAVVAQP